VPTDSLRFRLLSLRFRLSKKNCFSFAIRSLIRTIGWRRRYFRSELQKKKTFFFCNSLAYSYHWLAPKVLSLGIAKEKTIFLLQFARLFVPLQVENTKKHGRT
jgi:hypothetical protein